MARGHTFAWFIVVITLHLQLILCTEYHNGEVNSDVDSPFRFDRRDQTLSHNSLARLRLQGDGNFLVHTRLHTSSDWVTAGWSTATNPNGDHVELQSDGNLVVFNATGDIEWTSNSIAGGTPPFRLIVTDEAAVYILDSANSIVWSTNPSFASLQTVWNEPFNSNDAGWAFNDGADVSLPSTDDSCPNAPDPCVRVRDYSWVRMTTVIAMYRAIQLQVDIAGLSLETGDDDACEIWWRFDNQNFASYDTRYSNGVYKDVIIDIPLPGSYTSVVIKLQVYGDSTSDTCYFDNAILRGVLTPMPTESPTKPPTSSPTHHPTDVPTIYVTHETITYHPISVNTPSVIMILLISVSILLVFVAVVIIGLLYKLKQNKAAVPPQMDSVISRESYDDQTTDVNEIEPPMVMKYDLNPGAGGLQPPSQDVLELCDGENQTDVGNNSAEMLTVEGNEDTDQLPNTAADEPMTLKGEEAMVAPDEFVVSGDDEDQDAGVEEEANQSWKEQTKGYICDKEVDHDTTVREVDGTKY